MLGLRGAGDGAANRQLVSAAGWKIHSFITGPAVLNVGAREATRSSITSPAGAQIAAFSDGEEEEEEVKAEAGDAECLGAAAASAAT